jgi:hypothetical protein
MSCLWHVPYFLLQELFLASYSSFRKRITCFTKYPPWCCWYCFVHSCCALDATQLCGELTSMHRPIFSTQDARSEHIYFLILYFCSSKNNSEINVLYRISQVDSDHQKLGICLVVERKFVFPTVINLCPLLLAVFWSCFHLAITFKSVVTENLFQCWKHRNNWDKKTSDTVKIRTGALVS